MISIIICTRDRAESLKKTLSALARLQVPGATEIIVVDNASQDDTAAVVRTIASDHPLPVRLITEVRPGKSAALNSAIQAARGTVLAFTDDDALPNADWLVQLVDTFKTWQCDWVFGRVVPAWETAAPAWFGPELNGTFALLDFGPDPFLVADRSKMFFGVNCAVRRSALDVLGRYRVDLGPTNAFGGGGEDADIFYRALDAGQRIVYAPSAVMAHVIPAARTTRAFHRRRMFDGRRNGYRLVTGECMAVPRILGIPRFRYRSAFQDLGSYVRAVLTGDSVMAFSRELRLIFFAGIVQQAIAAKLRRGARTSPAEHASLGMDRS